LLVMLVGTAVAVFLLIRPPGETRGASPVVVGKSTPTATAASASTQRTVPAATPQASPRASETATSGTPGADATPAISRTAASPTAAATQSPYLSHVIADGDTLFGIAAQYLTPGDDLTAYARAIAALNGLDYDNPVLTVGKTIYLPKGPGG
jgi:hypothetical protein